MDAKKIRLVLLGMGVACSFYWVVKSCAGDKSKKSSSEVNPVAAKPKEQAVIEYYEFKHLKPDDLGGMDKVFDGVELVVLDSGFMVSGASNFVGQVIASVAKADVPRRQIDIDVKLIDVNKTDFKESAVKWLVDTLSVSPDVLRVGYDQGLNVGFVWGDLSAAYEVLEQSGQCRIDANPVLSCLEGETARITFGEKRPVVTGTSTTDGGTQISSYEYMSIGLGVQVTPYCGVSNTVQMAVQQTSEDVTGTTYIDGNEVPLLSSRQLSTSVRCEVDKALIIGGMKKKFVDQVEQSVPVLGSVPLVGRLFRGHSEEKREVELCVMLRPSVR